MLETGYFRIPGSRPHKLSPKKEKKIREQSWDNRFYLGKIPDYNAFHDKYLQNALPIQKKKIIIGVGRVRTRKNPSTRDLKSNTSNAFSGKGLIVKNQILKKLKQNLCSMWDYKEIPEAQRELFLQAIEKIPAKKQSSVLVKEIELYKQDKNFTQLVLRAIKARENSLVELRNFSDSIQIASSAIKHNCVESLINLRMLSLHVVECIQAWRKNLHELDPSIVPDNLNFIFQGHNYLSKMINDSHFLSHSPMSTFIEFQPNDPFFVNNSKQIGKIELPLPSYLHKRIKDSEKILNSEGFILSEAQSFTTKDPEPAKSADLSDMQSSKIEFSSITGKIKDQIQKYSQKVPSQIQDSMGKIESIYDYALSLRYPAFLWAKMSGHQVGLIALNLDNQKSVQNRILISHISALNVEIFGKVAESLLDYLWTSYSCVEIRVGIHTRINDKGKYECDPEIKSVFDKHSFRWKQMIYNQNEIPVQILGAKRQGDQPVQQFSIFSDSLNLFYACGLQKPPQTFPEVPALCSAVGIACAYRPYMPAAFSIFSEILSKSKGIPPAFRHRKDTNLANASKDLSTIDLEFLNLHEFKETSVACSSLGLSWEKFLPCLHNNKKFTKVVGQINVMKSNEEVVYVFPTEDPVYNVFIIPYLSGNDVEGFEKCKEILRNMEKVDELKEIWLPDFEVKGRYFVDGVEESFRIRVATASHPLGGLDEGPKEYSVIIESRFVFGMIHQKLVEDLELPLYVFDVKTDDFIKSS